MQLLHKIKSEVGLEERYIQAESIIMIAAVSWNKMTDILVGILLTLLI